MDLSIDVKNKSKKSYRRGLNRSRFHIVTELLQRFSPMRRQIFRQPVTRKTEEHKMPKKGENIYKRKDGRWEGRYIRFRNIEGRAEYGYIYGKSYTDVKQRLVTAKATVQPHSERQGKTLSTYGQLLDDWLHSTKITVKDSTYARYVHLIQKHIKPHLGYLQLSQLTSQIIEEFIATQLKTGRLDGQGGLASKTVTDILTLIKSTIEYARCSNYDVCCSLKKLSVKKDDTEMRVLTHDEQSSLILTVLNDMDLYKFGVLLSLYTGIRIGELCALKWEDMCLSDSVLKIRRTMQRIQESDGNTIRKTKIIITVPKSKCSVRLIPLPSFISDIAQQFSNSPQAFILTGDSERFVEPRTMQNHFKSLVAESGIERANFHVLRHTFATRCVEVGFEIKSLSEILGHSNVNITLNRYVHSSFELKSSNMNKLMLTYEPSKS